MNKFFSLFIILITSSIGYTQNFVPNPGFEDTVSVYCGIYLQADFNSSIHYWTTPTNGTPDLYCTSINQSCWNYQPNSTYPGPICILGSQLPYKGKVMAGIHCYSIPGFNQREYIQSPLTSPLVPGHIYHAEFYASLADHSEKYTDKLGAYFSIGAVVATNDQPLSFVPQIASPSFISDTSGWTLISDTFTATGAFDYMTIGNFYDDASTTTVINPGGSSGPGCYGVYYYIDEVLVGDLSAGINNLPDDISVTVNPNPVTDQLNISVSSRSVSEIILYDIALRKILHQQFTSTLTVNTEQLAKGIYFYEVRNTAGNYVGAIKNGKIVKQ